MGDALRLQRRLAAGLVLAAVAGCESSAPATGSWDASLTLAPRFATATAAVPVDAARIRIGRPASGSRPAETVLDSVVPFVPGSNQLSLRLRVPLKARTERLGVTVELRLATVDYYRAVDSVDVAAVGSGPAATADLLFAYVGPGASITTLRIAPRDSVVAFGDSIRFRVTGQDAQGAPVTGFPVTWATTDPLVPITAAGALLAQPRRVTIRVLATIPTGRADTVNLTFQALPVAVSKAGGDGQTGGPSSTLPIPLAVLVKAADSLPVAGVAVQFAAIAGGGAVRDPVVVTGANGIAATVATLGSTPGANQFQATVAGLPPVTFGAIATVGPASVVSPQSGGGQVVTVGQQAPQPLQVRVTDAAGTPVSNVTVNWAVASGTGTVAAATSVTNGSGIASVTATAGTRRGVTLVRATVTGVTGQAILPVSGTAGPAATLTDFNGDGYDVAADPLGPLEVRARDAFGNPIVGATVTWTVAAGFGTLGSGTVTAASVTDSRGIAAMQYLPDANLQAASVRASLPTGQQTSFSLAAAFTSGSFVLRTGGFAQPLVVGTSLASLLEIQSLDGSFFPVSSFPVDWTIIEGGGALTAAQVLTDGNGFARVGYTADNIAGPKSIQAFDHNTGSFVRFGFDAAPRPPNGLLMASGDRQVGTPANQLPLPLRVLVVDIFGNPVPGVQVSWTAISGGTVVGPISVTDPNGYAGMTATMDPTPGPASFRATVGALTVVFTAHSN